jgi:hypothetical protein
MLNIKWKKPKIIATESTEDTEVNMGHSNDKYQLKLLCAIGVFYGKKMEASG